MEKTYKVWIHVECDSGDSSDGEQYTDVCDPFLAAVCETERQALDLAVRLTNYGEE